MKTKILFIAAALFCCIQSHAQLRVYPSGNVGVEDVRHVSSQQEQEDMRKIPATTTYIRTFTYDASGNRILMSTPPLIAPSSPKAEQPSDEQVSLTVTTGMLRISLSREAKEPYSIAVYNTAGQAVVRRDGCRGSCQNIALPYLQRGTYIVDVCSGYIHLTKKFTKE